MTTLIAHHPKTQDLALFESDGVFWIGSYNPHMTHQNNEPMYVWIRGDYTTEAEGMDNLNKLTGDEF
jgi:hypothetical protein